jgi:hypothetical protein
VLQGVVKSQGMGTELSKERVKELGQLKSSIIGAADPDAQNMDKITIVNEDWNKCGQTKALADAAEFPLSSKDYTTYFDEKGNMTIKYGDYQKMTKMLDSEIEKETNKLQANTTQLTDFIEKMNTAATIISSLLAKIDGKVRSIFSRVAGEGS